MLFYNACCDWLVLQSQKSKRAEDSGISSDVSPAGTFISPRTERVFSIKLAVEQLVPAGLLIAMSLGVLIGSGLDAVLGALLVTVLACLAVSVAMPVGGQVAEKAAVAAGGTARADDNEESLKKR